MIPSTRSVPKPVVMHRMSPESLIEKAIFTEVKWVLLIANFAKLHSAWVILYIIETIFFLSVFLMAAETYLIIVIKSL